MLGFFHYHILSEAPLSFITIGISGRKQTGKTTFGDALQRILGQATQNDMVSARYFFAKPLKEICHILFGGTESNWYGDFKTQHLDDWEGVFSPPTPRTMMQQVGTELFRDRICDDFWLRVASRYIKDMYEADPFDVLIIDDVRFTNEAVFLQMEYKAHIVNLHRPMQSDDNTTHRSESGLPTNLIDSYYDCTDRNMYNTYALDLLRRLGVVPK
jgi:hypothetical protein